MKPRQRRFLWIGAGVIALGVAAALVLNAFQSNLVFFFTPTQVVANEAPQGRPFRIGGLVEAGSLKRSTDSLTVTFNVTDTAKTIPVVYTGLLPDLFKEGKGVVAQGALQSNGTFKATEVLAKHDENYMPPEAKAALDQAQRDTTMKGTTMPSLKSPGATK
jgi:cytochrome c-type biogenesis protein CcmE